jgi:bifunctional DNase/RNase
VVIPLEIIRVQTELPSSTGIEAGMVVLAEQAPPRRVLQIVVGRHEARAIMAAWEGAAPGRPSTWDLFASVVTLLGARIDRVVITAVEERRHYFAALELEQDGQRRSVACRPSDGLALAVRASGARIYCEEAVLDAAGLAPAPEET